MTEEELKAIRERCEKATPGPWHMNFNRVVSAFYPGHAICITSEIGSKQSDFPDADFIALVRTDIPKLLDEIERLKRDKFSFVLQKKRFEIENEHLKQHLERAVEALRAITPLNSDIKKSFFHNFTPQDLADELEAAYLK